MNDDKFRVVDVEKVPRNGQGRVELSLYIHLPAAQRFICFVVKGDELTTRKLDALRHHVDPHLYVLASESVGQGDAVEGLRIDTYVDEFKKSFEDGKVKIPEVRMEVISKDAEKELRYLYKSVLDPNAADDPSITAKLSKMADDVVQIVAPEVKDIKSHLLRSMKYLHLMNDAASITSLSILFALANGFDSQKSYKELSYATLIMDLSLSEFDEPTMLQYYRDMTKLSPEQLQKARMHPIRSHELAVQKLKSLTDLTMQLIQNHHELYNGKGFPRGVRNESLSPIARILSLAVDTFEAMKRHNLETGGSMTIPEALRAFIADSIEPHQRRHNTSLVQKTLKFLDGGGETTAA
jgi:response regulator RpfG family c-di-GMP phosphodiesterase